MMESWPSLPAVPDTSTDHLYKYLLQNIVIHTVMISYNVTYLYDLLEPKYRYDFLMFLFLSHSVVSVLLLRLITLVIFI